jgi:hypothetical protein
VGPIMAPSNRARFDVCGSGRASLVWDEIARTHIVDIFCGYVLNNFQLEQESHIYERICAEHSAVLSAEA